MWLVMIFAISQDKAYAQDRVEVYGFSCLIWQYGTDGYQEPVCYVEPVEGFSYPSYFPIPESINYEGLDYKVIGVQYFNNLSEVNHVALPSCVTRINSSFNDCAVLNTVDYPTGLTSINDSFNRCPALSSADFSTGLTSLLNSFNDCKGIRQVQIPDVEEKLTIGGSFNRGGIGYVQLPMNMSSIDLSFCENNLYHVRIGNELLDEATHGGTYGLVVNESFGSRDPYELVIMRPVIFHDSTFTKNLWSLSIYDSVYGQLDSGQLEFPNLWKVVIAEWGRVSDRFFCNAPNLTDVSICVQNREGISGDYRYARIGTCAFDGCNLNNVNILVSGSETDPGKMLGQLYFNSEVWNAELSEYYTQGPFVNSGVKNVVVHGSIYTHDENSSNPVGLFEGVETIESVYIEGSIGQDVGIGTFRDCKNLKTVVIPWSLSGISGDCEFDGCTALESIYVASKGEGDFGGLNGCVSLKDVGSANMRVIKGFSGCTSLREVTFEDAAYVMNRAFYNCSSLEKVTFGSKLLEIAGDAFEGCAALKDIFIAAVTPPEIMGSSYNLATRAESAFDFGNVRLHVPSESVEAYREASGWRNCKSIEGYTFNTIPDIQYGEIDLGLSVIWADTNVGAADATGFGNYYNAAAVDSIGAGSEWRVPTKEEFEELMTCLSSYEYRGNVVGFSFQNNGKWLFFPMAGCFTSDNRMSDMMNAGYYWVASEDDDRSCAHIVSGEKNPEIEIMGQSIPVKMPVRLVKSKSGSVEDAFINAAEVEEEYYNLQGFKVDKPMKGEVYIEVVNGRSLKVVY